jgi:hypothetical protein
MDIDQVHEPAKPIVGKMPASTSAAVFRSRWFVLALKIFIGLVAALLIFQLGMYVGFRKANFSYGYGDNYHRTFGGPAGGFMRGFEGKDFVNGHGTSGTVASVSDDGIVIKGSDGMEKMIAISEKTSIIEGHAALKASDLHIDDIVTVIGRPRNDGTVSAEIIRVFGQHDPPLSNVPPPANNY